MDKQIQGRVCAIRNQLKGTFLERNREIDGMTCALLAQEHVLLLGPPGTAKSALALAFADAMQGSSFFGRLMTKMSTPEEVFGPLDLEELQRGNYRRRCEGYLPTAQVAYLDEIFKASSAILNTMLTAMNERVFENPPPGWQWAEGESLPRQEMPLRLIVGASNELPEGSDLSAFHDRFLLRYWSSPLRSRRARAALLKLNGSNLKIKAKITPSDLDQAIIDVSKIALGDVIIDRMLDIRETLEGQQIVASDRRWRKSIKLMKSSAYLNGYDEVGAGSMEILADCLWSDPSDAQTVRSVVLRLSNPLIADAREALDAARVELEKIPDYDGSNSDDIISRSKPAKQKISQIRADLVAIKEKAPEQEAEQIGRMIEEIKDLRQGIDSKVSRMLGEAL